MSQPTRKGDDMSNIPEPNYRDGKTCPRIYVASLSDYNAGRLHGRWIDLDAGYEEVAEEVAAMLRESTAKPAEEYAIHGYEGFGPVEVGEHTPLREVCELAEGIEKHGLAFAHLAAMRGNDTDGDDLAEHFEDAYQGDWLSIEDYADNLLDDTGMLEELPDWARGYFDVQAYARDLILAGECYTVDHPTGVYVFRTC